MLRLGFRHQARSPEIGEKRNDEIALWRMGSRQFDARNRTHSPCGPIPAALNDYSLLTMTSALGRMTFGKKSPSFMPTSLAIRSFSKVFIRSRISRFSS